MLHRIFIFLPLFLCINFSSNAQTCLPEGINFQRQGQIDSFPINYPGCKVIEGDVCIGDCTAPYTYSDIRNLDSLAQLIAINGNISIASNRLLKNIKGLKNITIIEKDLTIHNNDSLTALDDLQQITKIKGSFRMTSNHSLLTLSGFEALDTIYGRLTLNNLGRLSSVDAFSNLKYLGTYDIEENPLLYSVNDLTQLQHLGNFYLTFNRNITLLPDFPILNEVQGDFLFTENLYQTTIEGFESIRRIGGSMVFTSTLVEGAREAGSLTINAFHNLNFVGGDFTLFYYNLFLNIDGFTSLDTIGQNLLIDLTQSTQNFLIPGRLKFIGENILLRGIFNLEDLTCFAEIDTMYGDFTVSDCQGLTSLSGLDQLKSVGGTFYLEGVQFPDLLPLSSLTSLGGGLKISNSDLITSLTGLEQLTAMNGELNIRNNLNLESLEGVENIDPQTISSVSIFSNGKLNVCNLPNICTALHEIRVPYFIKGNAVECLNIQALDCYELGLSGKVFFDANQNKMQDTNEAGIPGIVVSEEPGSTIVHTNAEGNFVVYTDEGTAHTIHIELDSTWILTTDSASYTKVFNEGSATNKDNNFGIKPATERHELSVNLASDATRCNQAVTFYLHVVNTGSEPETGRVAVKYDPTVQFINASIVPDYHNLLLKEMSWDLDTLYPYQELKIKITFKMPGESSTGSSLFFKSIAYISTAGEETPSDEFEYTPTVVCAIDPNDKLVMPSGVREENFTLKEGPLTYTIRFENKGNAEAINVTIIDTLDSDFDVNSLRIIDSSHPLFTSLNGHEIQFFFENIWLGVNKTGYVTYELKSLSDIPDHTAVTNKADIVFDFNQPIVTNTTKNTLVYELCDNVNVVIDTSICSGESFLGFTQTGIYFDTLSIGSTCDSFTEIRLNVYEHIPLVIDTVICEGESYLGYNTSGTFVFDSINNATGCLQSVELSLLVLPFGSSPCLTGIKDVNDELILIYPNPTDGEFYLEARNAIQTISFYTMDNRKLALAHNVVNGNHAKIRLDEKIPQGMYILIIEQLGKKYYRKLIYSR